MTYYSHWIIEDTKTGERYEWINKGKRAPRGGDGYRVIGCCGFHEKATEKATNNDHEGDD